MTPDQLIGVLRRIIADNHLRERHGEDTIGVLMKCGAFRESDDTSFIFDVAQAIDYEEIQETKRLSEPIYLPDH